MDDHQRRTSTTAGVNYDARDSRRAVCCRVPAAATDCDREDANESKVTRYGNTTDERLITPFAFAKTTVCVASSRSSCSMPVMVAIVS